MSYYQVTEACRMPILDWNYKWDLSSSTPRDSKRCSSPSLQNLTARTNPDNETNFFPLLESIKTEPPDNYPDYGGTYKLEDNSTKDKPADFPPTVQTRFNECSQTLRTNNFNLDDYVSNQPQSEWSRNFENNFLPKDKFVDPSPASPTKLGDWNNNFSTSFGNDPYNEYTPLNRMKTYEWGSSSVNGFETDNYCTGQNQLNVNEGFNDSNNLWSINHQTIKQEYDENIRILELYTPHSGQQKVDFYQSGLAQASSGRRFLNDNVHEISNDSVELLFERAGLSDLMQNSPDELLQIKELDDLITSDQPLILDKKLKREEEEELETMNLTTFNRKHYKCPYCAFNTNGKARLTEHMERLHLKNGHNVRTTRRRQSRLLSSTDKENYHLTEQKNSKDKEKSFKCTECAYTTNHIERLQKHIEKKHFIETYSRYNSWEEKPPDEFKKTSIFNPKRTKSGSKPHKCTQCFYEAHRNDRLMKHIDKIHSKNVCYKCSQCEFVSTYNREYYEHMKSHFGGPPFRCEKCAYKSKLITAFIAHRVTHTGERNFNCMLCSFSCKRKYHLKGHMISHSKEKNFDCKQCGKKYSYKCSLVRHSKTSCRRKPAKQTTKN